MQALYKTQNKLPRQLRRISGLAQKADELRDKCGKARLQDAGFVNAKIKNIYKWQKHLRKK